MMRQITLALAGSLALSITQAASAAPLNLPEGMGGVPNIGAIPCSVFSEMLVIGPKGTRLSLLTWAEGYFFAKTGKTLDEILERDSNTDNAFDFYSLTDQFVEYCSSNPEAKALDAVAELGEKLAP